MKKKGFCFKRAVSLLLAAAMLVTAAPQTSLTALAAEQGMTMENPDASEDLAIMPVEDGASTETGDAALSESDDDAAAGDSGENAEPEEGTDGDPSAEDESVSGNDVEGGESVSGNDTGEEPVYKGEVTEEEDDEGAYTVLHINEWDAEANAGAENESGIMAVLAYYAEQGQKFNSLELNVQVDAESSETTLKKEYIDGAVAILGDDDADRARYWIDYNIRQGNGEDTVVINSYSLWRPRECDSDINVNLMEVKPHQGVLFSVSTTAFPSEEAFLNCIMETETEGYLPECLGGKEEFGVLIWDNSNGIPTGRLEPDEIGMWFDQYQYQSEMGDISVDVFCFGTSIESLQTDQAYMVTSLYRENVPPKGTKKLTAGERSGSSDNLSDVKWGVFDEELISIEPAEDNTATLTAKEMGEAYYYVIYQSGTDRYLELHAVRTVIATEGGKELGYVGEIRVETIEDGENAGTPYRRLVINEWEAKERNEGAEIADILTYYAEQITAGNCEKFNCVEFCMDAPSSPMKKENINGAISIMDTENNALDNYWIDYSFWNDADSAGVCYTLSRPDKATEDIDAACTVTLMSHQGVKINLKTTEFPAEAVGISYNKEEKDAFAACWDGAKQEDLRLLALDDGGSSGVIGSDGIWFGEYTFGNEDEPGYGSNFGMGIEGMQAGHDYLITPLYADQVSVAVGTSKNLTAGERSGSSDGVSGAVWKSLNESLITIEAGTGADATLTARGMGEAYYYVTYTREGTAWLELHSVQVTYGAPGGKLAYIGEVIQEKFEDGDLAGIPYVRLIVDEAVAAEQNKDKNITPILEFYKEKGAKFNCIDFHIMDESPDTRVVKKDYINGALSIMDTENDTIGYWVDYGFWNDRTQTGVNFALSSPCKADADVNAAFTLTELKNYGLKVQFTSTAFPSDYVSMSYDLSGGQYADSLPLNENPFRLFTHSSGTPKALVNTDEEQGWGYYNKYTTDEGARTQIYFNNIRPLGTTEYLAASIYEDEERPTVGGPSVQLKAGKRAGVSASSVSSVTWKLFDTDIATIDQDGKLTAWSNRDAIYYYAQYKVGSTQYLEVHEMHPKGQPVEIYFDEDNITMEMNADSDPNAEPFRKYLRLRFKPSDAERDPHDPSQIKWEITEGGGGDKPVIDFVYYDNDWNEVERDENGRLPEGAAPNGEIKALNEGTATVKVSYLDVGEGEPIPTATCHVKVVRPITWEDMEQQINAMNLYAVTDLDTKLSDVTLGTGWKWENPDTPLANFKGMDGCQFPAVYTAENGKTFSASLWVRFVNVTGVELTSKNENKQQGSDEPDWFDWTPDSVEKGGKVTLGYAYIMDNLNGDSEEIWQQEYDAVADRLKAKYRIDWTSGPANAGTVADGGAAYQFTAPTSITKAQKYTFTVSLKDKTTNKVFLKDSCAITVTVDPVFDWEKVKGPWASPDAEDPQQRWFLRFDIEGMTKKEYEDHPLTIVSEDPAILKLQNISPYAEEGTREDGAVYTNVVVPCENPKSGADPKPGTAWIKMTASDEIKSTRRFHLEFIDKEPKLTVSAVTINQALTDRSAAVTVRTHMQYPLDTSQVTLLLNGNATTDMTANVTDYALIGNADDKENSYYDYNIKLALKENAASVKKGKNTVTLKLAVKPEDGAGAKAGQETYSLNLTVNVVNTVPKVTFKQAKKVNLFYTDEKGYGILNVNVTGTDLKELKLENCDFEVKQDAESGEYRIAPKASANGSSKKGKLSYQLAGCSGTYTANFTVSAENRKPTIVLSQKSDTLYPMAGYSCSWLSMSDKATGDGIVPSTVTYVDKKNNIRHSLTVERDDVDWENHSGEWNIEGKTDYNLIAAAWGGIAFLLQDQAAYRKKTDKFSLEIKEANWKEPVAVSYSIKVDTARPKLVFGKSTLTLNKNDAVYRAQQERTSLHLKGTADSVYQDEWHWVRFEGQDENSRKILRTDNSLLLQYRNDQGDIIVNFNDNSMDVGTYKFKVSVGNRGTGLTASAVLTVKIVDIPMTKTLKVTAKGSIDVMNREGTSIAYTPKISNISGKVVDGWLEGMDSDLFDNWWEDGRLIVKARPDVTYSTRHTYRVRARFEVETLDYERLTVYTDAAKPLTVKVKQSKPKLSASTAGNTIYRQLDNTVEIKLNAVLNNREVEIEDVWLINYTDDFELRMTPASWTDEEGNAHPYETIYNPETKSVRLGLINRYEAVNAIKSGKAWKVKLAVRYRAQAGNEKKAQVTCSVIVR